ncbi:MAG: adenylyltransferase/cytidyltransferase family protein [Lachnospiraceae bacterium]|nr:adenylyltransferase/cytidyltransferase family protein [Lachnospiraceae bacterium]
MKKYKRGYTQGVYDMFHVGHLNLLNRAKEQCEYLIVGVNSDSLVQEYKHKVPVINGQDRRYIVENIKAVDEAILVDTLDKMTMCKCLHFDVIFIGDDWKGNPRWEATREQLKEIGVDVVFLPYTSGVCSTELRKSRDSNISETDVE